MAAAGVVGLHGPWLLHKQDYPLLETIKCDCKKGYMHLRIKKYELSTLTREGKDNKGYRQPKGRLYMQGPTPMRMGAQFVHTSLTHCFQRKGSISIVAVPGSSRQYHLHT